MMRVGLDSVEVRMLLSIRNHLRAQVHGALHRLAAAADAVDDLDAALRAEQVAQASATTL